MVIFPIDPETVMPAPWNSLSQDRELNDDRVLSVLYEVITCTFSLVWAVHQVLQQHQHTGPAHWLLPTVSLVEDYLCAGQQLLEARHQAQRQAPRPAPPTPGTGGPDVHV